MILVWVLSFRLGEARKPGPCGSGGAEELAFEQIQWAHEHSEGFSIGTFNPSGINNKFEVFKNFPAGWWGGAETQASRRQVSAFRASVRNSSTGGTFRVVAGHDAPLRAGSLTSGAWTGVLHLASVPLREIRLPWPEHIFESGRVVASMALVDAVPIVHATVYLPPRGPTYPAAKQLGEAILAPITKEIVLGRKGCRVVTGDFNWPAGALQATKQWQEAGWKELQDIMSERYNLPRIMTCKGATAPDQIWISPELQNFLTTRGWADFFPDHLVLAARFRFPPGCTLERHWSMPQRLSWDAVDKTVLESACEKLPTLAASTDTSVSLLTWSRAYEEAVAEATKSDTPFPGACYGRAATSFPTLRHNQLKVPRHSRAGEEMICSSFLGRSVQLWFQQYKRFINLRNSLRSSTWTPEVGVLRQKTWQAIQKAKGFRMRFSHWWPTRAHKLQGSPEEFPQELPKLLVLELLLEDYAKNYKAYESWNLQQRTRCLEAKMQDNYTRCFAVVKKDPKDPLDSLVDTISGTIQVLEGPAGRVVADCSFPQRDVIGWTLNQVPATVASHDDHLEIDSDLLLVSGQTLSCYQLVSDLHEIHRRLETLWTTRWQRHADVGLEQWTRVLDFAKAFLPRGQCELPPLTYEMWQQQLLAFKPHAARGPDGWARTDLLNMPRSAAEQLVSFFNELEAGQVWPSQWTTALIHTLEKVPQAKSVGDFRPITLFSVAYRCWAGLRSSQLLRFLARFGGNHQFGFAEGCQAADLWYLLQADLEIAQVTGVHMSGAVGDLVKAYNLLPRLPVWGCLQLLGVPVGFLDCWQRHLSALRRHFVVRGSCSSGVTSTTGFPEGCPLSCTAMYAVGVLWHCYMQKFAEKTRAMSYVDNLEVTAATPSQVVYGVAVLREFCTMLDIELDENKLYCWSTSATDRRWLREQSFTVKHGARDLGGQVNYGGKCFVSVVVDRLNGLYPMFQRLRVSKMAPAQKKLCIQGALWPRGLHGCESVPLGSTHFDKLRSGVMKAMHWDRAGASPCTRLSILNYKSLEPEFYQLWRCLAQFRRQCARDSHFQLLWARYQTEFAGRTSCGPFAKLSAELAALGWTLSADLILHLAPDFSVSFLQISDEALRFFAEYFWLQTQAAKLTNRACYADLHGVCLAHIELVDGTCSTQEKAWLDVVRDGSFFTGSELSKFDRTVSELCSTCGVLDTREHRYRFCPHYGSAREHMHDLTTRWDDLPQSMTLCGLPSALPAQIEYWRAFYQLPEHSLWQVPPPTTGQWNLFSDGTCSDPKCGWTALAAWSFVDPASGLCVGSGPLPGWPQTIARAELWAVVQILTWGADLHGDLHIWCDSQSTVDCFRVLQQHGAPLAHWANADLWHLLQHALARSVASIWIHKVASHGKAEGDSALVDWCTQWNAKADSEAKAANHQRPLWFQAVHSQYTREWHRQLNDLLELRTLHLEVAKIDTQKISPHSEEIQADEDDDELLLAQDVSGVQRWLADRVDDCPLTWMKQLGEMSGFGIHVFDKLVTWLTDVERSAEFCALLTIAELYVGFVFDTKCDVSSLCTGVSINPFIPPTFAAECRLFTQCLQLLFSALNYEGEFSRVSLPGSGIHCGIAAVRMNWTAERMRVTRGALKTFVGRRLVTNCQGLAKPWRR